jgi:hypothetical protein
VVSNVKEQWILAELGDDLTRGEGNHESQERDSSFDKNNEAATAQ